MINVDVEVQSRVGKPCMSWIFADLLDFMWENSLSTQTVGYKDCTEVEELTFFAKGSSSAHYFCSGKATQKSKFLQLFVPLPKSYWRATKSHLKGRMRPADSSLLVSDFVCWR